MSLCGIIRQADTSFWPGIFGTGPELIYTLTGVLLAAGPLIVLTVLLWIEPLACMVNTQQGVNAREQQVYTRP